MTYVTDRIADLCASDGELDYHRSWQDASGASPGTEAPKPIDASSVTSDFYIRSADGRCWIYLWCTEKDELNNWWSCRMMIVTTGAIPTFDMWEAHHQRQGAKARARANAKVHRLAGGAA